MKIPGDILHRRFTLVELLVVMMHRRELLLGGILVLILHGAAAMAGPESGSLARRERQQGDFWQFGENGRAATDVVLLGAAADSELVANAADWIANFVERSAHVRLAVRKGKPAAGTSHLVPSTSRPAVRTRAAREAVKLPGKRSSMRPAGCPTTARPWYCSTGCTMATMRSPGNSTRCVRSRQSTPTNRGFVAGRGRTGP